MSHYEEIERLIERLDITEKEAKELMKYFEPLYMGCSCDSCREKAIDFFIGAIQHYCVLTAFPKKE